MEVRFSGFERIVAQPNFCDGQPRIAGTRITVGAILTYLAGGMTVEQLLTEFPKLERADISQALGFAK